MPPAELAEIAFCGDVTENQSDLCNRLLEVPVGGECILYFDSPGGSPYTATALASLLLMRDVRATGVVIGECSSAALWPFAACRRRIVTPFSVLLFHRMRWQSEENVVLGEAAEWARHFAQLETDMDRWLAEMFAAPAATIDGWVRDGRYVTGTELAQAGMAELLPHARLPFLHPKRARRTAAR